jgi:lipopolysaccharide/colanic/teichoic acid biosynthesis glycosyltransferase
MYDNGIFAVDELTNAIPQLPVRPLGSSAKGAEDKIPPGPGRGWMGKRVVDVVFASVLLLVTLPLFVVLALVIKLTSAGPVFFRQRRVGRADKDFLMLKFRTMHTDSEQRLRSDPALQELFVQGSHKIPADLDPRITSIGRVLRRLSLDEMPQLLNVLLGHMSLVGPRPVERTQLVRDYGEYQSMYVALRPGLTGLWQVSGRSTVQFPERALLDCHYLQVCGPLTDAKIILRTPRAVVSGLGAS